MNTGTGNPPQQIGADWDYPQCTMEWDLIPWPQIQWDCAQWAQIEWGESLGTNDTQNFNQ